MYPNQSEPTLSTETSHLRRRFMAAAIVALALSLCASPMSQAEPTEIDVRVLSTGAKFIGTSMGGCLVTIRDADTGELLAKGKTQGSTGDTERIMKEEHLAHDPVSTGDSAVFHAELDIDTPTLIEVTASGPLAQRQSTNQASVTQWLVPGKHVTGGDGLLLEMRGFVVDIKTPPTHLKLAGTPVTLDLSANVTMMCGCPVEPGGLWNADEFEVAAIIKRDGKPWKTVPLDFAGETSQFAAKLGVEKAGVYEATVFAYDPANGNTGLDKATWIIQ